MKSGLALYRMIFILPYFSCSFQHCESTNNVGIDKAANNGAVNMSFSSKMDDAIDGFIAHPSVTSSVTNISLNELIVTLRTNLKFPDYLHRQLSRLVIFIPGKCLKEYLMKFDPMKPAPPVTRRFILVEHLSFWIVTPSASFVEQW